MELTLALDAKSTKPLQAQVFDQVREIILDGQLKAGTALPPSRVLAERLRVSRNTVMMAYERLAAEGYVRARGTAGLYVEPIPPDSLLLIQRGGLYQTNGPIPDASSEPLLCFAGSPGGGSDRPELDFWVGRSDPAGFPLRVWRRIVNRLLAKETAYLTDYCDPAGLPELRAAIGTHLRRARAVAVTEDQVIVTTGGQDALNLVFNLLKSHTRQLCIENPCYLGASLIFRSAGLTIHPTPVDGEGLRTDLLPAERGSLLYVTPSHQFPTGATMTLTRRLALLQWAEETDSYIVEDDYDSDFRYDGPPLTALAGLDGGRRVFYAGTFSKSVGAGLRIGFATVPRLFWDEARMLKARMSNGQAWLEQAALAAFIDEGHFDRHLRRLRQVYKARRDRLVAALRAAFEGATILGGESGLHLVWKLPPGFPPARQIQVMAREQGIGIYALSSGAAFDFDAEANDDMLVFGYSSLTEAQIEDAVRRLRLMLGEHAAPANP
ncbi:PLP-dependent aminotransferase family protein [Methylobacterium oxalidis]|uniref:8-amino-7-oxononanoate synthase n=1 Tax=Methylobacterium oxalidis TaxID=944322 RepID=A0A512JAE2_9HYPH|nr:PLP-dependent aminotransferase family protein [Methylobacterium oxalidis]GEP06916.1 GntR family transcriptional regulator [Methylobacterium oxalidis]GJE33109.1 HTH-type transcriptional regulatory protein GabR [Methylobacterium oxalidis]GLS64405.1 GntR family transcriptional regulator [Methylobacterium oxalidis]